MATRKERKDLYRMVPYGKLPKDAHGYTSVEHKPGVYDLVLTVDKYGKRRKGWWNGISWDGFKISKEMEIVKWKRVFEDYCSKGGEVGK